MDINNSQQTSSIHYAGFWRRFLALIIDGMVINSGLSILAAVPIVGNYFSDGFLNASSPSIFINSPETLLAVSIQWLYNILMVKHYGATLGKMALRMKVVSSNNDLDWITVILRETVGKSVSAFILGIGYLMVAWDARKQALHDKIAGTYVIIE